MKINSPPAAHIAYRPDIDGLRAFAVLSVVIYHAFPSFLTGGFIGVDIFFVISGYLIATIIFKSLAENKFSFLDFYARRVNRIFPALILVLTTCYVVGWFTLISSDFKLLGKHLAGGIGFVQNLVLYKEEGYFDAASESKVLLHLWSLGVEEQFYLLFPVAMWILWRWKKAVLPIIIITAVTLLFADVYVLTISLSAGFYMPQYRFWEILTGSIAAYCAIFYWSYFEKINGSAFCRNLLSISGASCLILSLLFISRRTIFPGYAALLPVSGALFIIIAGSKSWLNKNVLSSRMMVWIGLISYPLYLWHWVVITYIRLVQAEQITFTKGLVAIFVSVLFAFLTYKFLELPLRRLNFRGYRPVLNLTLGAVIFIAGIFLFYGNGYPIRPGSDMTAQNDYAQYFENSIPNLAYSTKHDILQAVRSECDFFDMDKYRAGKITMEPRREIRADCYISKNKTKILLWGDSHVQHYNYGLKNSLPDSVSILQVASSACEAYIPTSTPNVRKYCDRSNAFALEVMKKEVPDILVIAQSEGHDFTNNLTELAARAKSLGVRDVIVIGPVPHYAPLLYQVILKKYWNGTPRRIKGNLVPSSLQTDRLLKKKYSGGAGGFDYLSAMDVFCNLDGCLSYLGDDRKSGLVTYDYGHLTPQASLFFAQTTLAALIMKHLDTIANVVPSSSDSEHHANASPIVSY